MTKTQVKFYNIIIKQIVDYEEIFHKEFIKARIEKISDDHLKYLLEDINTDKDKIVKAKGYMTYAKFIHYADKMIDSMINTAMLPKASKVEELYNKRALLLHTIEQQVSTIKQRNELIENLKNRVVMFKENGRNILDDIDYFIIDQFGFYSFFDENKNYHIKEDIEKFLKQYTTQKILNNDKNIKKLSSF